MKMSKYIDHTILKADARKEDIERICREAKEQDFASVCVNSCWVSLAKSLLEGSTVKVCTVVGFPLGAMSTAGKVAETEIAVKDGAEEIDMVINVGALKEGNNAYVEDDIHAVVEAAKPAIVKVIIETCLLTDEEKERACRISEKAGAAFVKTSTGFSTGGANAHDVALMRRTVGDRLGVKASGGIHTPEQAEELIRAGADRIGASNGAALIRK